MKNFNEHLRDAGIAPEQVAMCFHKPVERAFARFLPYIAAHEPGLLEAYQSSHSDRASALLADRQYMASFVQVAGGVMAFAGLFRVQGTRQRPVAEICAIPEVQKLYLDYAVDEEFFDGFSQSWQWFYLERESIMADLVGRLQIARPQDHDYMQQADRLEAPVVEVADSPVWDLPMPAWDELVLVAREVMTLPPVWQQELTDWRGIYLVTDEHCGARYVGATTAGQGLLACWQAHINGKAEGTAKLMRHDPAHFRFAILERLEAGATEAQIAARRASWILRLGTGDFGLNERK